MQDSKKMIDEKMMIIGTPNVTSIQQQAQFVNSKH